MKTTNSRLMHVTFASGALVLALAAATPTLGGSGHPLATRAGAANSWGLRTSGVLAFILRFVAPPPVQGVLPLGVVVDDGVPF